jgi:hypothetical protein
MPTFSYRCTAPAARRVGSGAGLATRETRIVNAEALEVSNTPKFSQFADLRKLLRGSQ